MRTRLISLFAIAAITISLAACKKSSSGGGDTTPKDDATPDADVDIGTSCDAVGANVKVSLGGELSPDQVDQAASIIAASCVDDGWSEEAKSCVATASGGAQMEDCRQYMDAGVAANLDAQMEAIFDGGGEEPPPDYDEDY